MWFEVIAINPEIFKFMSEREQENLALFIKKHKLKPTFIISQFDMHKLSLIKNFEKLMDENSHIIKKEDIGKAKGSPLWIDKICEKFNVLPNKILIIGRQDNPGDWRTAINGGAFFVYLKHNLSPINDEVCKYAYGFLNVENMAKFWEIFFIEEEPLYTYKMDIDKLSFRSLLDAGSQLFVKKRRITLKDIFTYENMSEKLMYDLRYFLTLLFLTQLYKEGLVHRKTMIGIYPSHQANKPDTKFSPYLEVLKGALAGNYFREDLIIRTETTIDKSYYRSINRYDEIKFENEYNTIKITKKVTDKTIIVFDDFSTSCISFESARLKLNESSPSKIVLCAIGKYGFTYVSRDINGQIINTVNLFKNSEHEKKIVYIINKNFS